METAKLRRGLSPSRARFYHHHARSSCCSDPWGSSTEARARTSRRRQLRTRSEDVASTTMVTARKHRARVARRGGGSDVRVSDGRVLDEVLGDCAHWQGHALQTCRSWRLQVRRRHQLAPRGAEEPVEAIAVAYEARRAAVYQRRETIGRVEVGGLSDDRRLVLNDRSAGSR